MGRNWFTTREWLKEYKRGLTSRATAEVEEEGKLSLTSTARGQTSKRRIPTKGWLALFLITFLIIVGVFLFLNLSLPLLEKIIPAKVYWIP